MKNIDINRISQALDYQSFDKSGPLTELIADFDRRYPAAEMDNEQTAKTPIREKIDLQELEGSFGVNKTKTNAPPPTREKTNDKGGKNL